MKMAILVPGRMRAMKFRSSLDLMDPGLKSHLANAETQIEALYKAEEDYLTLKAARDTKWAILYGKMAKGTVEDKKSWVNSHPEWEQFAKGLALAEASFHREKHRYEIRIKYCDAAHLSLKVEKLAIERGVGS
jgi:hypothetical protein